MIYNIIRLYSNRLTVYEQRNITLSDDDVLDFPSHTGTEARGSDPYGTKCISDVASTKAEQANDIDSLIFNCALIASGFWSGHGHVIESVCSRVTF